MVDVPGFDRAAHERMLRSLLRRVPRQLEPFHSQRLLLLYFAVTGCDILGCADGPTMAGAVRNELRCCYDTTSGGFCPVPVDAFLTAATLTMTHCAVRVLEATGGLERALQSWLPAAKVAAFVAACYVRQADTDVRPGLVGGFRALPGSAEVDLRFTYSAIMTLRGVGVSLEAAGIDEALAVAFLLQSVSPMDGGFASVPGGAEAHCGMTFCGVASLSLMGRLHRPELAALRRRLRRYCIMRVGTSFCNGAAAHVGFQGRPNKPCDSCYTHWVGCSLKLLEVECTDACIASTVAFVLACQDAQHGGFAKGEEAYADPLHTCLALSGVAVLAPELLGLRPVAADTGAVCF